MSSALFYAGLFVFIVGLSMFVNFLISKTPIGKSKMYKNLKESLKNIFNFR